MSAKRRAKISRGCIRTRGEGKNLTDDHSINSSVREKTLEHVFVGDCLRWLWNKGIRDSEVLRADVDTAGYDIVMDIGGVMRHIQLKASFNGSKTPRQKINTKLGAKHSGCVVWMGFDPKTIKLGPFYWFGGAPGEPLPDITNFKKAKHEKGNAQGVKAERQNSYVVNKGKFEKLETLDELMQKLFGV